MKKTACLIIALCIALSSVSLLSSCTEAKDSFPPLPDKNGINKPGRESYSRPFAYFADVQYNRPDVEAVAKNIKDVAAQIQGGALFQDGLALIKSAEGGCNDVNTMYTLAEINYMRNSIDEFWSAEYDYMSASYPTFSKALEDLFAACARSGERGRYENEYFGYSLFEYIDGGVYNERIISLMQTEASLEAEYMKISESTVTFTYMNITDTYEGILKKIARTYGIDSEEYATAEEECYTLLYNTLMESRCPIFLELVKTRRLIADEMGLESYTDYAYSAMSYDYTSEDMLSLLSSIKDTVYPVYLTLYERAFRSYFYNKAPKESPYYLTVNNLYELYSELGGSTVEAYSYMLDCGLYDIGIADTGRYGGAFTAYIEGIDAPFLFMTVGENITDYLTLSHEYGHFLDGYLNGGTNQSLDLSEVSSQTMELLTVNRLSAILPKEDVRFLEYYQMYSSLDVLLTQGLFSAFEHLVYELEYDEITEKNLNNAVMKASEMIFGKAFYNDFGDMLIQHTVVYPHYVQSYCTSQITSLEIFFKENVEQGLSMDIYIELLTRDSDNHLTFQEELAAVGLSSPFDRKTLKQIVDSVHYEILGSHYFKEMGGVGAA